MNKSSKGELSSVRMLTVEQGQLYTSMGRNTFREYCNKIGATRHFGRSVRYDKTIIDSALDAMDTE